MIRQESGVAGWMLRWVARAMQKKGLGEGAAHRIEAAERRLLADAASDAAVFVADRAGRIASWAAGAERVTGRAASETLGRHVTLLYPIEDVAGGRPQADLAMAYARGCLETSGWCLREDGSAFWASVVITKLRDATGRHWGFGFVARDRTAERRAEAAREEQMRRADEAARARDEFLTIASHELRTPLSALVLQLDGAERALSSSDDGADRDRALEKVGKAIKSTARLTALVDNLLEVSRLASGSVRLALAPLDAVRLLRAAVRAIAPPAAKAGTVVVVQSPPSLAVEWDEPRMSLVFESLLSNALKYGRGQPIRVELCCDDDVVRLIVRDEGIGISREDAARIFDRFERAVPVRHYGGFGLGLYTTRRIVEAHGGRVRVTSAVGVGSTFVVEVPRRGVLAASAEGAARVTA